MIHMDALLLVSLSSYAYTPEMARSGHDSTPLWASSSTSGATTTEATGLLMLDKILSAAFSPSF